MVGPAPAHRDAPTCAWPGAWRSTAWPTAGSCARTFEELWVQPAAGDGAERSAPRCSPTNAVSASRAAFGWTTAIGGPSIRTRRSRNYLDKRRRSLPDRSPARRMIRETARLLAEDQAVVGWFQGGWMGPALARQHAASSPMSRTKENWHSASILKIKFRRRASAHFAPARATLSLRRPSWKRPELAEDRQCAMFLPAPFVPFRCAAGQRRVRFPRSSSRVEFAAVPDDPSWKNFGLSYLRRSDCEHEHVHVGAA